MVSKKFFMIAIALIIFAVACGSGSEVAQETKVAQEVKEEPAQPAATTGTPKPTALLEKTTSFTVGAGEDAKLPIDIPEGYVVEYSFTADNDVDFRVVDPEGTALISKSRVIADQGEFRADVMAGRGTVGRYYLVFDNEFSDSTSKTVTMVYRIVTPDEG